MFDDWNDGGASASTRTPLPGEKPIRMDGDIPVFAAQPPVTDKSEATPQESPPLTQEPPADPHDVPPANAADYRAVLPDLAPGQTRDESATTSFLTVAHATKMPPSLVREGFRFFDQSLGYLRTTASEGSFDTSLERLAASWKERAEHLGATPKQIQASIKAAVDWIEKHPDAIFGRGEPAPTSMIADVSSLITQMQSLANKGLKGSREWDQLQEQLSRYFAKRSGGGYIRND